MAKEKVVQQKEERVLDANGKILGRIASEAAHYLQGKHRSDYKTYMDVPVFVRIQNAQKIKVTGKKFKEKIYWHYSGYPGGIYHRSFEELFKKDPTRVIRKAVYGMLPKNRLRRDRMTRLIIEL